MKIYYLGTLTMGDTLHIHNYSVSQLCDLRKTKVDVERFWQFLFTICPPSVIFELPLLTCFLYDVHIFNPEVEIKRFAYIVIHVLNNW